MILALTFVGEVPLCDHFIESFCVELGMVYDIIKLVPTFRCLDVVPM